MRAFISSSPSVRACKNSAEVYVSDLRHELSVVDLPWTHWGLVRWGPWGSFSSSFCLFGTCNPRVFFLRCLSCF